MTRRLIPLGLLVFGMAIGGCTASAGADADGDGLSDEQEERFGTDPAGTDTDCDGIPDGQDPVPLGKTRLSLTAGPIYRGSGDGQRCVKLDASLRDGDGKLLAKEPVAFETEAGPLDVEAREDGSYLATLCTVGSERVEVVATYAPADACGRARDVLTIRFGSNLPQPGVNTGSGVGAGPADGKLRVVALDVDTVGFLEASPQPFAGAAVMVRTAGGLWFTRVTGADGIADFEDEALVGPLDVHVGAEGHRFTSYVGIDARNVAVAVAPLDPVAGKDEVRAGAIEGEVTGFLGEYAADGVARFQAGRLTDGFTGSKAPAPIAIVQVAVKNRPLSSMSMGSVLTAPPPNALPIPANMAWCGLGAAPDAVCDQPATFRLDGVPEGQHLLFALGGLASEALNAVRDPYELNFRPQALGIVRVRVHGGEVTRADIPMRIDLRPDTGSTVDLLLDEPPIDWKTGKTLANVLAMPVMDTGGEGFIFVSVDGSYNREGFDPSQPLRVRFPEDDHPVLKALGIPRLDRLAVGLAGRATLRGADPPGISTPVRPQRKAGDRVGFNTADIWLDLPRMTVPEQPSDPSAPLDEVSPDTFNGTVEWQAVSRPRQPHLYVLRINYMTPAPYNMFAGDGDLPGSLGGPVSHCLWEIFVPGDRTKVDLPAFPDDAPARPLLANPDPSMVDPIDPETGDEIPLPQHYGPRTIELELSAYLLEAGGKSFRFNDDFAYDDVNLQCSVVSQDSFVVQTP